MSNSDLIENLRQEADYLRAVSPNGVNAGAELMDEAIEKIQHLQERNDSQAETIKSYRTSVEFENLKHQLNEQYIEKARYKIN